LIAKFPATSFICLVNLSRGVLLYACLFLVTLPALQAQPLPSLAYKIKAAFLFNFTQFIDWPAATFPVADSPFVIGVLGEDPFGPYLDETVAGEKKRRSSFSRSALPGY
jgi:hypothetical protein